MGDLRALVGSMLGAGQRLEEVEERPGYVEVVLGCSCGGGDRMSWGEFSATAAADVRSWRARHRNCERFANAPSRRESEAGEQLTFGGLLE